MADMRLIDANVLPNYKCKVTATVGDQKGPAEMRFVFWQDIEKAPTIDAVEVVHGRWEDATEIIAGIRFPQTRCTACGKVYWGYRTECYYCPNCGAKMDGGAADGSD